MNTALWVVQFVLSVVFFSAGTLKVLQTREQLVPRIGGWLEDYPTGGIKAIGVAEVLAAVGLIVPPALGVLPVLAPLAAVGLVAVMAGAIVVHARRGEYSNAVVNIVLAVLAIFVAWGRFGPYKF
jgi:uncharacterized membrane protein YphA (DoxX/SURF4 family)